MRSRPLFWLVLSLIFFAAAGYLWRWGDQIEAKKHANQPPAAAKPQSAVPKSVHRTGDSAAARRSLAPSGTLNTLATKTPASEKEKPAHFKNRLTNTTLTPGQLAKKDKAILLENALLDTEAPI